MVFTPYRGSLKKNIFQVDNQIFPAIHSMKDTFNYILIDTPPVGTLSDVQLMRGLMEDVYKRQGVSLKFFETLGGPKANAYVVENVLLFIPFGILVPLKWKQLRNTFVCTFLGFCLSCVIEIMQLITERGHFQVDDILTNTLGALIGGIVFRAISFVIIKYRHHYRHDYD